MIHTHRSVWVTVGALALGTLACNVADNQALVPEEHQPLANPEPLARDHATIQSGHEILLGVIDTGVDYNHPSLINHIHFDLDSEGNPQGAGWDVTGQDAWPSPYLVRTAEVDQTANPFRIDDSNKHRILIEELLTAEPELAQWLHPMRDIEEEEMTSIEHGTHVAGLMVYDDSRLGLKPYRVLPMSYKPEMNENAVFGDVLVEAIEKAAKDGVRVVNLSLGMRATRRPGGNTNEVRALADKVGEAMAAHPEILFVTAAGNDSSWTYNEGGDIVQLPCGVELPNVLCVGSTSEAGRPSGFTNIPLGNVDLVFAWGESLRSTVPAQMCKAAASLVSPHAERTPKKIAEAKEKCLEQEPFAEMSGTSMASPVVARLAAQILLENSVLRPAGVIEELRNRARPSFIGQIPVYKLRIDRPSWMPKPRPSVVASKGGSTIGHTLELFIPERGARK